MPDNRMDRDKWVEVFRATGLEEKTMQRWHQEFERRYPAQHQEFLEWIQIPSDDIRKVWKQAQA